MSLIDQVLKGQGSHARSIPGTKMTLVDSLSLVYILFVKCRDDVSPKDEMMQISSMLKFSSHFHISEIKM